MRMMAFAGRNHKEVIRDPLNLAFGMALPVVLLIFISVIFKSMKGVQPVIFIIDNFAPGMAVFSLSFITLFLGILIAGDRESSFLLRIFASPLKSVDYIMGYSLPLIPIALIQSTVCFVTAFFLGLSLNIKVLFAMLVLIPVALLFISFGLLLGIVFTYKQVGGISSIIVQVSALMSGTWFDLNLIGGAFKTVCYMLPFAHAIDAVKDTLSGNFASLLPHLLWVIGYTIVIYFFAVVLFKKKMQE